MRRFMNSDEVESRRAFISYFLSCNAIIALEQLIKSLRFTQDFAQLFSMDAY